MGFTIGMVLGMLPKGNLIALAVAMLLCAVKVNRAAGLMAAGLFSLVGPLTDPVTHKLGATLLTQETLQRAFAWLYDQPLGPFLGFHNTVTIGALMLAVYSTYPCYYGSHLFFSRLGPPVRRWIIRYRLGRTLAGAQFAARYEG